MGIRYDFSGLFSAHGLDGARWPRELARAEGGVEALRALHGRSAATFPSLPEVPLDAVFAGAQRLMGFEHLVVIGIGGSSLGSKAVYRALVRPFSGRHLDGRQRPGPAVHFLENVDPLYTGDLLDTLPLERTGFVVITKSGGTIETMSNFFIVRDRLRAALGDEGYRARMIAVTDPEQGALRSLVGDDGLESLDVPPGVGGRFSVLTAVGLLPLAAAGLDVAALLAGAAAARDNSLRGASESVAACFAAGQVALLERGIHDVVLMPYATGLADIADWFVQLWAESLGKLRGGVSVGPTPIRAVGAIDQHSQLQLFMEGPATKNVVFIAVGETPSLVVPDADGVPPLAHLVGHPLGEIAEAELRGVRAALAEVGRPSSTVILDRVDERAIGSLIMTLECATAIAGTMLEVDPYDQPGVELAKKFAHGILGRDAEQEFAVRLAAAEGSVAERSVGF